MNQPVGIKTEVAEYIHKTHKCLLDVTHKIERHGVSGKRYIVLIKNTWYLC